MCNLHTVRRIGLQTDHFDDQVYVCGCFHLNNGIAVEFELCEPPTVTIHVHMCRKSHARLAGLSGCNIRLPSRIPTNKPTVQPRRPRCAVHARLGLTLCSSLYARGVRNVLKVAHKINRLEQLCDILYSWNFLWIFINMQMVWLVNSLQILIEPTMI